FTACTAEGLLAAICSAVASAHGMSSSAGITRLIRPIRAASAASMRRPVRSRSMACACPICWGSLRVAPPKGWIDQFTAGAPEDRGEQQLEAAPDAVAVHCGDHWLGVGVVLEERMAHHARRLCGGAQVAADVGARAEGARAHPREDDAAAVARLELVPELR